MILFRNSLIIKLVLNLIRTDIDDIAANSSFEADYTFVHYSIEHNKHANIRLVERNKLN